MGKIQEIETTSKNNVEPKLNGAADAERERQFRAMLDALPEAVYTTDAEGRLTHFNQAAVKFSGRVPELGTDKWCVTWKLFYPDGSPMRHDECPMAVAIKERRPVLGQEAVAELPDGTRKWFAPFPVPLFDDNGELIGGINMLIDISEKKRFERSLTESEMMLSMAMQSSRMGAWERDIGIETVNWSPELTEIFGLKPGSFDGTKTDFLNLVHEDDREIVQKEVARAIDEKRGYSVEFRFHHGDGSIRWMEGRGQAVYAENGDPVRLYGIGIDITDRKKAEETIAKTAAIVESSDDAIISKDLNGIITSWNASAERLFGYTADETIGQPITILIPPDRLDEEPRILDRIGRGEKVDHFETVRLRKDGSTLDISLTISPVKDGRGRVIGASKIARDITANKRAEEALRESERRFAEFMQNLPGLAWIKDKDGRYAFVNDAAEKTFGVAKSELYGRTDDEIFPPETAVVFKKNDRTALDQRKGIQTVEKLRHSDGVLHYSIVNKFPINGHDDDSRLIAGIAIDITERKKAEDELRLTKEFGEAVMGNMGEGLYTVDADGVVTSMNRAAERLFGWTYEELRGRKMHEVTHYKRRDGTPFPVEDCAGFQVLKTGKMLTNYEDCFIRKDGTVFDVMYSSSPIRQDGRISGLVVVFADITERKRDGANRQYLFEIAEIIRQAETAKDLFYNVAAATGAHFGASRCLFNQIDLDADRETIDRDYVNGVESVTGSHKISDYSPVTTGLMANGKTVVNFDSQNDERTAADYEKAYKPSGERSYIAIPLLRNGTWVASLWLSDNKPRVWSQQEVSLLETVAERTWLAVEKMRSEKALRESEEQYRTLFSQVPVAVYTCDAAGTITTYNQNAVTLWGREPRPGERFNGSHKMYDSEGRPLPHDNGPMARVLRGETLQDGEDEMLIERMDGARKVVIAIPGLLRGENGDIIGGINCLLDVTELKLAQRALIRAERRAANDYQALLQLIVPLGQTLGTARDLITIYRAVRDFICSSMSCSAFFVSFYSDQTGYRTAGYAWGEGEEIDTSMLPPMPITPEGGSNSQAILDKKSVVTNRYWDTMKNRPHVVLMENGIDPMSSLVVPMIIKDSVIGTLEVQAHEDRAFSAEHVVAMEMVANLAAVAIENVRLLEAHDNARQEAVAANRTKDEFLSVLSHELRTPLNSMMGWIRMLRLGNLDSDHTAKAIEVIDRNTRVQSSLIEDLLDVSRIISGKMRVETELTDLAVAVKTATEGIRPIAAAKNIEFVVNTSNEPLLADGDPMRLQQVVTNLVQNAIKFTPEHGRIEVSLKRSGTNAILDVSDSGIGIEKELQPYIFERFRQGDASTKRGFAGLGLGLTIVRTIVELHGGRIGVQSDGKDRGSLFTVTLPLSEVLYSENGNENGQDKQHLPTGELDGVRILLVDDDLDSLKPLQLFLEGQKASVAGAESAAEALEKLVADRFDIMITDIGMPVADGFELVRRVRSSTNGNDPNLPAIAVTAYASPGDRERAFAAGFQAHLAKPVNFDEVLSAVQRVLATPKAAV